MSGLVRVRVGNVEKNVGAGFAERFGLDVLEQSTHNPDGTLRGTTRRNGRPVKPKVSVAEAAAAKKDKASSPVASTPKEANE